MYGVPRFVLRRTKMGGSFRHMKEEKKKKKAGKKKWEFPVGIEPMDQEEAEEQMQHFFKTLEDQYKDVPEAEIGRGVKKIQDFLDGKMNWAELFSFTPDMLFQMAEYGFSQFKMGRYSDAERVFKVLTVLDWNNPYYHSVMGSILQRQKRYGEAMAEYSQAIDLDKGDIVSLTNRGEILMQHGLFDEALADLEKAAALDPSEGDKFAARARMLIKQIKDTEKLDEKVDS